MNRLYIILIIFFLYLGNLNISNSYAVVPLVSDISNQQIYISTDFQGQTLLLFGSTNFVGQLIITVHGANESYILRKQKPQNGIWINSQELKISEIYDYYAIYSNDKISPNIIRKFISNTEMQKLLLYKMDYENILPKKELYSKNEEFYEFFTDYKQSKNSYQIYENTELQFISDNLFKTKIFFPDTISEGNYIVTVYLLNNNELSSMQVIPIYIRKVNFYSLITEYMEEHPILYGLAAIFIAMFMGWVSVRYRN